MHKNKDIQVGDTVKVMGSLVTTITRIGFDELNNCQIYWFYDEDGTECYEVDYAIEILEKKPTKYKTIYNKLKDQGLSDRDIIDAYLIPEDMTEFEREQSTAVFSEFLKQRRASMTPEEVKEMEEISERCKKQIDYEMMKDKKIIPNGSIGSPFTPSPNLETEQVKLTNETIIKSVDEDQGNIIKNIIKLHIPSGKIDCDITYSVGNFYKKTGIEKPIHKFDKFPQTEDSIEIVDRIPLEDESIDSLMFDPPFLIGGTKDVKTYDDGSCIIGKRFAQYKSIEQLMESYSLWIKESTRVLKKNGILIVKCQDSVSGGKQYLTHNFVNNEAVRNGLYPKDLFILVAKNRLIGPHHHNQQHCRKYHSYFLVFKKEKFKNIYL